MRISCFFLGLCVLATFFNGCKKVKGPEGDYYHAELSVYKDSAMGVLYNAATNKVAYNKPDANGIYKIYVSNYDGTSEVQITHPSWDANRHQWAEEWDPTGNFLICYIEKTAYVAESGHTRSSQDAIPGYGGYTDIWIVKSDGSQAWQMTNLPNDYDHGVIHGAISSDGSKFAWTERIQRPVAFDLNLGAGAYVFKVADVTWGATPLFSNIQSFQPGGVLAGGEVESISPDNSNMLIYSSFETQNMINTPIYRIDLATGATTKLFEGSFNQTPTYTPNGQQIVFMSGKECDIFLGELQGADWWIMNADGSNPRRMTYMNKRYYPECVNHYRLAGSLSFVNDTTFIGGVMTNSFGLVGYSALVRFKN